jgi:hypothetical protein
MEWVSLLQRWQAYDPETGRFDRVRTNREYARLLGIHEASLSKCYAGLAPVGLKPIRGLARLYPAAVPEIGERLSAGPMTAEVA